MKVVQVCKENCKNIPYEAQVKSKVITFCCKEGFEKSLVDFQNFLKNSKKKK